MTKTSRNVTYEEWKGDVYKEGLDYKKAHDKADLKYNYKSELNKFKEKK